MAFNLPALHEPRSDKKEEYKLINALRDCVAVWGDGQFTGDTLGDGAYVTLWSSDVPAGAWRVRADVTGIGSTGGAVYQIDLAVSNPDGITAVTIGGTAQMTFQREAVAAMDARLDLTGTMLALQVRDDGVVAMSWKAILATAAIK